MTVVFSGFSEFGVALADYLAAEPAARGGVLSDGEGDAVDFAYARDRLAELDAQILGAQLEHAARGMTAWAAARGLGRCEILLEASHGRLCSAFVAHAYVLVLLLDPAEPDASTESERLLGSFRDLRRRIEALLLG